MEKWRCFWRWPPGHKWEQVSDAGVTYRRCQKCGYKEGSGGSGGTWSDKPHEQHRTGGGV